MKKLVWLIGVTAFCAQAYAADSETDKKILKDALVGAVTGAVAVEASNGAPAQTAAPQTPVLSEKEKKSQERYEKKMRERAAELAKREERKKKRPRGWEMGKKEGWGGGDEPPGLAKKEKTG
jgi:hypothetical protein